MTFLIFTVGIIFGLLFAVFAAIILRRYEVPIQRNMDYFGERAHHVMGKEVGYIAGMSDEEQSFADSFIREHTEKKSI